MVKLSWTWLNYLGHVFCYPHSKNKQNFEFIDEEWNKNIDL